MVTQHFSKVTIDELLTFYNQELQKSIRYDFWELIKLSIIFLGGDNEKRLNKTSWSNASRQVDG